MRNAKEHEITINGIEYVTKINDSSNCNGCAFRTGDNYCFLSLAYNTNYSCNARANEDYKNRIWVKKEDQKSQKSMECPKTEYDKLSDRISNHDIHIGALTNQYNSLLERVCELEIIVKNKKDNPDDCLKEMPKEAPRYKEGDILVIDNKFTVEVCAVHPLQGLYDVRYVVGGRELFETDLHYQIVEKIGDSTRTTKSAMENNNDL